MRPTSLPSVILDSVRKLLMILGFVLFVVLGALTLSKVATPTAVHHHARQPELQVIAHFKH